MPQMIYDYDDDDDDDDDYYYLQFRNIVTRCFANCQEFNSLQYFPRPFSSNSVTYSTYFH
jgi:hypothetical protein